MIKNIVGLVQEYQEHKKFNHIVESSYIREEEEVLKEIFSIYPVYKNLYKKEASNLIFKSDQKKFKKLIFQFQNMSMEELYFTLPILDISNKLIRANFSPDIIFNEINFYLLNNFRTKTLIGTTTIKNIKIIAKFLNATNKKGYIQCDRLLKLFYSPSLDHFQNNNIINLIDDLIQDINEVNEYTKKQIKDNRLVPRKPKSFHDMHQYINQRLVEMSRLKSPIINLKPREDLLKLHQKEIEVKNKKLRVYIAKTNHDLIKFSMKSVFDNCVGRFNSYTERGINGTSSFVGIFEKDKPLYCIETSLYNFKEAKGVSNQLIPKDIRNELENLLTLVPEVPEDFISIKHSFISGYKYNPETEILYLMFNKGSIYEYLNVSNEIYENFSKADYSERTKIFQKYIRTNKNYMRVA